MIDRINHGKQIPDFFGVSHHGISHNRPYCSMCILSAILPDSRTYPFIYPGSMFDLSNGGSKSKINPLSGRINLCSMDNIACLIFFPDPALDKTDQLWAMASIWQS